jgi:uncharacterized protein (DUF1499 family)
MRATHPATDRSSRIAAVLARAALGVGLACGAAELLSGPAYRTELLSLSAGLLMLRWAAIGALAGAALAVLAGVGIAVSAVQGPWRLAGLALAVNLLVAAPPLYQYRQVQRLPHIHDISTDTANQPLFVAIVPLRQGARNPIDYAPATAEAQRQGYPDIAPARLDEPPAQAFARAQRAARAMGWEIVASAPADLRIEATATTLLFGFKDDVVIRVTPQGQGSIVDVRSLSRVGGSDFGTNAKRVRAFLRELSAG